MNAVTEPDSAECLTLKPLRPSELANAASPCLCWLWHGYLAPGKVTALVSAPKSGKTTLATHLLSRLAEGGKLAGLAVAAARALVVSEEDATDWAARCGRHALGQNMQFLCRPFQGARPTEAEWFALIAGLESLHAREALDLVMIDALAALLPGYAETCAPKLLDCLLPLQALANHGPAVWLLHHPAKGKRADGQSARGSGALLGFADIVMEMSCYRRARSADRRRRICAYSRYVETARHLIIELAADSADYIVHTSPAAAPRVESWPPLEDILAHTYQKLSQQDILDYWPNEEDPPDRSTLSRWLKRAVKQGVILCTGAGHRGDSLRYWLPGREPLLFPGHDAGEEAIEAWKVLCEAETRRGLLERLGVG